MARASGASTVVSERNKGKKCEEEADLISDLPDCLIQHILSFLPTTKDAIRTGILSKRWLYQWTHIPNLIFYCNNGMSIENFPSSIDDALNLYNCSKINKFLIDSKDLCSDELREKLTWWIDFAAVRDVKELILDLNFAAYNEFELPQSLFKNEFLVKLKAHSCYLPQSEEKVNWSSLKALYIDFAYLPNDAIENVLSGSPVIECLELGGCYGFERLFVASESLKTFRLSELDDCNAVEISCANLEKLELLGQMSFTSFKLKDLPPSVCATLDFEIEDWYYGDELNSVREFLLQVQHIEDLEFGSSLLKVLSVFAKEGVWSLLLNSKSLTVINPFLVATQPGIAFLLISCPLLERLVIQLYGGETFQIRGFEEIGKDFWESDASAFDCPVSHLKTVEIVGLYYISSNGAHNDVLKIFTFLLKNAIMLEKMVFLEDCGHGMVFAHEVCKKLACVQKASLNAIIKAECLSVVGTSGASSTISEGNEGKNKRMKCEEEDDFISALPDCLIQHILSFLPSTKDAIRTGILSKRWLYQWTCVPNLILYCNDGMSIENFPSFVDDALNLYNCSKINKFVINSNGFCSDDLREKLARWINFAVARDVKILILDSNFAPYKEYVLPQFLFKNEFLAKLKVNSCYLSPSAEKVNWSSLKALCIDFAYLPNNAIENVLSGSPVIEDLELCSCYGFERLVIASKSLKTFCLSELDGCNSLEISCANLEKLELLGQMSFTCCKLKDLPPSVSATFDFEIEDSDWDDDDDDDDDDYDELEWVKEFLLQVQYIEDLKLGYWLVMVLSVIAVKREFSLLLNSKSFTMIDPFLVETQPGIAFLLISCSVLEKLVIQLHGGESFRIRGSVEEIENDFWESDERAFDCPVSHLRTVEIVGLYYISSNGVHKDALKIFTFLLKNAIMLEKMVFLEDCEQGMVFADDVCKKLKCVQKASSNAIVKAECLLMVDLDSDSDWDKIVC